MEPKRVHVYAKTTGRKQVIPAAWLDHPVLGANFQQTPLTRKRSAASKTPVEQADSSSVTIDNPENGDKE